MTIQIPKTILVNEKELPVENFSDEIKNLVTIFAHWQADLISERMKVAKSEAALRALNTELSEKLAEELKSQEEPEFTEVEVE